MISVKNLKKGFIQKNSFRLKFSNCHFFSNKLNLGTPTMPSKFKNSVSLGNLGKTSSISSGTTRQNVSSNSSQTTNNTSITFTAKASERPLTRGHSVKCEK